MWLTGAGLVISVIGCTVVFVETDLDFMRTTAAQLHRSYETLIPLVAHDRASLGGMLIANGVAVWLSAQWGFRAGARWLWVALAWGGNIAFACATVVHLVVGYHSPLHLAPAMAGWVAWNVGLLLAHGWLARQDAAAQTPPTQPLPPPPCVRTTEPAFTSFEDQPRIVSEHGKRSEKLGISHAMESNGKCFSLSPASKKGWCSQIVNLDGVPPRAHSML